MSVLIKDMAMPKDGVYWCEIGVAGDIATITIHGEDRKSFPLIEVPESHGRLIDADAMLMRINHEVMEAYMDGVCYGVHPSQEHLYLLGEIIDDASTIIPASEEGEA